MWLQKNLLINSHQTSDKNKPCPSTIFVAQLQKYSSTTFCWFKVARNQGPEYFKIKGLWWMVNGSKLQIGFLFMTLSMFFHIDLSHQLKMVPIIHQNITNYKIRDSRRHHYQETTNTHYQPSRCLTKLLISHEKRHKNLT